MKNPDVLVEALTAYQARKEEAKSQEARSNLATYRSDITSDPATPFSGNPSGDVTVVEFFDYNCGYCKRMVPAIQELLQSDGKVRYVFKEFPILGPQSLVASKAALAVWKLAPEKHFAFHVALMGARGELSEERILGMAEKIGIDGARLRTAMEDPAIEQQIRRNLELGRLLDISGTPGFVIGERIVPGAIDLDTMRSMIADARGK
jgi:protein-disulfide isomerase